MSTTASYQAANLEIWASTVFDGDGGKKYLDGPVRITILIFDSRVVKPASLAKVNSSTFGRGQRFGFPEVNGLK
ncbi:hypothetical protein L1987_13874 [Smallanthus sonchifolius]|uniref:Uncharacterized protein n=1 Tax=Smallanthus sonchifolius TaxID=185202 RepID=A0ACB9JJA5_9ASTR|nr:hypothetical protein L1987_13874 [Smallanthus sonchifolius]